MIPGIVAGRAVAEVPATDPFFSNVGLLLHFDGADASTTFTDSSGSPKTMTARGGAQLDTDVFKFGTASGLFDGISDAVSTADSTAWDFANGNFTVECWIYLTSLPSNNTGQVMCSQWSTSTSQAGWFFGINNLSGVYGLNFAYTTNGSTQVNNTQTISLTADTWHHLAFCRSGADARAFFNGVQAGTTINFGVLTIFNSSSTLAIGATTNNPATPTFLPSFAGRIDDLRITKGVARYTSDFTPPAAAFPNS